MSSRKLTSSTWQQAKVALTSHQLQKTPKTEDDEQTGQLAFLAPQDDLEHERRHDDEGIEEVERRVWDATVRIVEFRSERPEREGDFDEEERRDYDRYQGEHLEPGWGVGRPGGLAVGGQKGIGEVN